MNHSSRKPALSQEGAANRPFAMLPHDFAADKRLTDGDIRVLFSLLYWTRAEPDCWPCVETIAKRANKKERSTRMALKNLEHFGYIRSETDSSKRTGRRIVLVWKADGEVADAKEGDSPRKRHKDKSARARMADAARHMSADKEETASSPCVATEDHQEAHVRPSDIEITSLPVSGTESVDDDSISNDRKRAKVLAGLATLSERHGRGQAVSVNRTAKLMAALFFDEHSLNFHRLICWRVAKGQLASQLVADAFVATYDKVVENEIEALGPYYVGCLRTMVGDEALDQFTLEFKEDRERAKKEYACQDANLLGEVA